MKANILLNTYAFHEPWAASWLERILKPDMTVTVVALSFNAGMNEEQAATEGHRADLLPAFMHYGIAPGNVQLINWFRDTPQSAREKIQQSDVLFFTGGWPDHMMYRLRRWKLTQLIEHFDGVIMGCSAGAMVQLKQYHITPDEDYPTFSYQQGMDMLDSFYMEVHYRETDLQQVSIDRVRREKGKPVFAVYNDGGLLIEGSCITPMGRAKLFLPEKS